VNRTLPPARLSARLLNALSEHARVTHPEECCGLLVGDAPGEFAWAERCRNEMTRLHQRDPSTYPRDGKQAFHMNEADMLRVLEAAEAKGQLVTGVYHSHADAGAYFSEVDQEFARRPGFPFPEAQHIVISVVEGRVAEVALFCRVGAEAGFEGRLLVGESP
jgi:adenylyltransferase/sulfurtransferase